MVALSSCETEFMAETEAVKLAIWLQDLLSKIVGKACEKVVIQIENIFAIISLRIQCFMVGVSIYTDVVTSYESVLTIT